MLSSNSTSLEVDIIFGVLGLAIGSFLNVFALRSLSGESLFGPPSHCPKCLTRLGIFELVPILSFIWLKGKCKHCRAPIAWYYPVVEAVTAICFIVVVRVFGLTWYGFGMLFFVSTLIAICITDFKEKLIPHDITYPAMLFGIAFSVNIRHDFWGTMAGIAISYIFFDFLAHYALKVYLWFQKPDDSWQPQRLISVDPDGQPLKIVRQLPTRSLSRTFSFDPQVQATPVPVQKSIEQQEIIEQTGEPIEDFEVIGGGDAVLSALISAWLGLNRLFLALFVGFLVGTVMGAAYLLHEMYKQRILKTLIVPVSMSAIVMTAFVGGIMATIAHLTKQPMQAMPLYIFLPMAAVCGGLFGVILAGRRASKPYPFGPALAVGAVIAALQNPLSDFGPTPGT